MLISTAYAQGTGITGIFDNQGAMIQFLPLVLIFVVLSFLLMPAVNAFSRHNERQADRYAFENISSVSPFIS